MELRVARHTDRLEEVVAFYRDRVGLPELGRFTDHDGYDGAFLDIPGTGSHLEFTTGGDHPPPVPHPESLLVIYVETQEETRHDRDAPKPDRNNASEPLLAAQRARRRGP